MKRASRHYAEALRVMAETLPRHEPGWVALSTGANDVSRYGTGTAKPLVTAPRLPGTWQRCDATPLPPAPA